jgi:uncharacterized membrane protein YhaH (DUF805 family)
MQQPAANPYRTPGAQVADQGTEELSQVKLLSIAGRIGRVRYIGYSVGITLVFYAFIALGAGLSAGAGIELLGGAIIVAAVIGMLIVAVMLTIQRCHDFDVSGWLSLLLIVPVAPLLFWIIPGTKGTNRFGAPTPPNSTGVVVLALILPILFFVGIIAAIALPAYQSYVERARMAQELQQQSQAQDGALDEDTEETDAGAEVADEGSGDEPAQTEAEQPGKADQ